MAVLPRMADNWTVEDRVQLSEDRLRYEQLIGRMRLVSPQPDSCVSEPYERARLLEDTCPPDLEVFYAPPDLEVFYAPPDLEVFYAPPDLEVFYAPLDWQPDERSPLDVLGHHVGGRRLFGGGPLSAICCTWVRVSGSMLLSDRS